MGSSSDEWLFNVCHGGSGFFLSGSVYAFCVLLHLHCQSAHVHIYLMLCMHGYWAALEGSWWWPELYIVDLRSSGRDPKCLK